MGLNEGVNVFVDDEGKPLNPIYVPAYVRRYPYHARPARPERARSCRSASIRPATWSASSTRASPCSTDDKPSETLNAILKFCEEFEVAGAAHRRVRQGAAGDATC